MINPTDELDEMPYYDETSEIDTDALKDVKLPPQEKGKIEYSSTPATTTKDAAVLQGGEL